MSAGPTLTRGGEMVVHECDCSRCDENGDAEFEQRGWTARCCTFFTGNGNRAKVVDRLVDHLRTHHGIESVTVLNAQIANECPKCGGEEGGCKHCHDGIIYEDETVDVAADLATLDKAKAS